MLRSSFFLVLTLVGLAVGGPAAAQDNPFASCTRVSNIRRLGQETVASPDRPGMFDVVLKGLVEIECDDTTLSADQVTVERDTDRIRATGHVVLRQRDLVVYADRADLNSRTKLGVFHEAQGSARIGEQPAERSQFGTLEPDVLFHGRTVERVAPTMYRITDGGFTTCVQPAPRWEMTGSKGTIVLDKRVLMANVVLKVKEVPLFYLPILYYPINKEERSTGFLLPSYGASTLRGTSVSNAFFWAIGRTHDATFYHDWFASTGNGVGAEYRYKTTGGAGNTNFYVINEHAQQIEGGTSVAAHRSYRIDGSANQTLPRYWRIYGRMNYFTDASTQQSYQDISQYSQRQRMVSVTLTGAYRRFRVLTIGDLRDLFYGTAQGQRTGRGPLAQIVIGDKAIGGTKIYYGANTEAVYFIRQNDITRPETNRSLWRFDATPTVRAPLSNLPYLTATGSASWRITNWLETIDPVTGQQVPVMLTRQLLQLRAQMIGPVVARVFQTPDNGYADRFKHLIQPSFTVERNSAFRDLDRVVKNDYAVDQLVGGVTTVNYRITNRVLARRRAAAVPGTDPAPGIAQQILSVDISQSYYTDSLAANSDPEYSVTGSQTRQTPAGTFSPIQLTAIGNPTDTASVQFRMEIDSRYKAVRTLSASGSFSRPLAFVTGGWSKRLRIPGLAGFDAIGTEFLNASTTVRTRQNGLGGTYALNLDIANRSLLQQRVVAYYNTQCCGVSFDWQNVKTPLLANRGVPNDRRLGLSFTLAGIGSFSNPFGSFGGG